MKKWQSLLSMTLVCLSSTAGSVLADGIVRDSMGAISSGRGGTNIAHADNGAILLNNPAGMVNIEGNGLYEFGLGGLITNLDYADPENSRKANTRPGVLPDISYIRKSENGRWAAGIGVFAPAGFSSTWEITNPTLGTNAYKSFGALVKILPGFAYKVTDRFSVGGTVGLAISHVELESPFFLQTGALAGAPTLFDMQANGAAPTWSFGMQYQISERTNIGFNYMSETRFGLEGSVAATIFTPAPIASRFNVEVDLVWPRSAGIGITHMLSDRQRISADLVWYDWSGAFDRLEMQLTNPSNPAIIGLVGPRITDSFPLDWQDSVTAKIGYEIWLPNDDIFRVGYIHNTQSVPSATLTPLIPAILAHSFTVGYGTRWKDWDVNFAYQYAFGPDVSVDTSAVVGGDFTSSTVQAQAHWSFLSFRRTF